MPVRFRLACVLVCLALPSKAIAAKNVAVIRQPSLLMFGDVKQAVGATYNLNSHSSSGNSTTSNALGERYVLQTSVAILDPDLLLFDISAGASHHKEYTQRNNSSVNLQYNIMGTGLVSGATPFSINTSRNTSFIATGYTPAYTVTSNNTLFSLRLQNEILPVQFSYGHGGSSTSGLARDYSTVTDSLWLSGSYGRERSRTDASWGFSSDRSAGRDGKNFRVTLSNASRLDAKSNYLLNTILTVNHSRPIDVTSKTLAFSESLSAKLGAALNGSLSYNFSDSSTVDFEGTEQTQTVNTVSGTLTHRLFKSLTTTFSGSYDKTDAYGGETSSYSEGVALAYTKQLVPGNRLGLNAAYTRRTTDQKMDVRERTIPDEQHAVPQPGEFIIPNIDGTLIRVLRVRNRNPDPSLGPDLPYQEGVDYRVDPVLGRIEIVPGRIAPGTELLITYVLAVNPEIKYQSDSYTTGFILSLLGNRYMLSGNVSSNSSSLISGSEAQAPLAESTSYNLRGDANYGDLKVGAEYFYSDSTSQEFSKVSVLSSYSYNPSRTDSLGVTVSDSYYMYPGSGTGGSGYTENTVTASASYIGLLWQAFRTTASVTGTDNRNRFGNSNTLMMRVGLGWDYRKLSISVDTSNLYRLTPGRTSRDTSVVVNVARSF